MGNGFECFEVEAMELVEIIFSHIRQENLMHGLHVDFLLGGGCSECTRMSLKLVALLKAISRRCSRNFLLAGLGFRKEDACFRRLGNRLLWGV